MGRGGLAALALVGAGAACGSFGTADSTPVATADAGNAPGADAGDGSAATASGYPGEVLADSPLLYLRLGEDGGVLATDSSGHGTDGAYLGNTTKGLPGAIAGDTDTAVRFGTANWDADKVRVIPPFDFASQSPFTLEAWVKPETNGDGAFSGIVGRTAGGGGWTLFTQYDVGWIKFSRSDADGGWDGPWYQTSLPRDRFTHVVGTYNGTTMHLYIDGLDVGQSDSTRAIPASTDPILIGNHFPGILDEIAVYDHELSPARVRAHHQAGVGK